MSDTLDRHVIVNITIKGGGVSGGGGGPAPTPEPVPIKIFLVAENGDSLVSEAGDVLIGEKSAVGVVATTVEAIQIKRRCPIEHVASPTTPAIAIRRR